MSENKNLMCYIIQVHHKQTCQPNAWEIPWKQGPILGNRLAGHMHSFAAGNTLLVGGHHQQLLMTVSGHPVGGLINTCNY